MATSNVEFKKTLKEYKTVSEVLKKAEDRKKALKAAILEEIEVRGIPYVQGESSKTKTVEVEEYAAVVTTFDRDSVSLDELVKEFGRDLLNSKKLINSYPIEQLRVALVKPKK